MAPETGSPAYTRTRLAQSSGLKLKPTQATLLVCLSWDAGMPYASHKQLGQREVIPVPHISGHYL